MGTCAAHYRPLLDGSAMEALGAWTASRSHSCTGGSCPSASAPVDDQVYHSAGCDDSTSSQRFLGEGDPNTAALLFVANDRTLDYELEARSRLLLPICCTGGLGAP